MLPPIRFQDVQEVLQMKYEVERNHTVQKKENFRRMACLNATYQNNSCNNNNNNDYRFN